MKTKQLFLFVSVMLCGLVTTTLHAQSSSTPDTVCAGTNGAYYKVSKTTGSTYYWTVPNGTIASGSSTDSITVNWSSTPGTDTIKVVEVNAHGCIGDTQKLAVWRMPLPTAALTGVDSICWNHSTSFTVAFTSIGPWNFSYSDGTTTTSLTNISANPYTISTGNLSASKTYTITAVSNKFGCTGTFSGSHVVVVNPKPTTSAIFHK